MNKTERRLLAALVDALDGLEDMIGYVPEYFQEEWDHQAYIGRAKAVLEEVGGGGIVSRGDSPDSPTAGESGLPGADPKRLSIAFAGDDPRDDPANITPLSPKEFIRDTRVDWPVIPEGWIVTACTPMMVSVDSGLTFHEKPDGTPLSEFLGQLRGN